MKIDLISIRQAIEALKICDANYDGTNCDKCPLRDDRWDGAWWDDETDCHTKLMRDTAKLLETLSAQPERKKGTWTNDASCPFCGFKPWYERDIHTLSFCPNCGADMREQKLQYADEETAQSGLMSAT